MSWTPRGFQLLHLSSRSMDFREKKGGVGKGGRGGGVMTVCVYEKKKGVVEGQPHVQKVS
jgi:hypothetical protein